MARPNVRRAHMVTKGYLRAWADSRNRVDVIDLGRSYGYVSSINNATVQTFAYEPSILTHDLEREYATIERDGLKTINRLRDGNSSLSVGHRATIVAFLDMHLDRGRYADQADVRTPATLARLDGLTQDVEFNVADRLLLSQSIEGVVRLSKLGVKDWEWHVLPGEFITGDGAVLLFRETDEAEVVTVTFPLSPTQLLLMGKPFDGPVTLNPHIIRNSRRWAVARPGTFRKGDLESPD